MNVTIRKAFKLSCELKNKIPSSVIGTERVNYTVSENGLPETYVREALDKIDTVYADKMSLAINCLSTLTLLRDKIAEANSRVLPYLDNRTINQLISRQLFLNKCISLLPEKITVTAEDDLLHTVRSTQQRINAHLTDPRMAPMPTTRLQVQYSSAELAKTLQEQRLEFRNVFANSALEY
ncbi:hypothetical protein [Herbiconiux daphne]|uniref:Uncharacterized protein n=1 Tax=Herbiconiux daphne TaxID=2970914 RepID=A0ABT2HBK3_9MICO|nr:hypothetical protein [Herbiconiux daphne]MCS5737313.1 hypothetical protein [Herbiconiux daphne]